eukprot:763486-Hanusia_phi.AAC.1
MASPPCHAPLLPPLPLPSLSSLSLALPPPAPCDGRLRELAGRLEGNGAHSFSLEVITLPQVCSRACPCPRPCSEPSPLARPHHSSRFPRSRFLLCCLLPPSWLPLSSDCSQTRGLCRHPLHTRRTFPALHRGGEPLCAQPERLTPLLRTSFVLKYYSITGRLAEFTESLRRTFVHVPPVAGLQLGSNTLFQALQEARGLHTKRFQRLAKYLALDVSASPDPAPGVLAGTTRGARLLARRDKKEETHALTIGSSRLKRVTKKVTKLSCPPSRDALCDCVRCLLRLLPQLPRRLAVVPLLSLPFPTLSDAHDDRQAQSTNEGDQGDEKSIEEKFEIEKLADDGETRTEEQEQMEQEQMEQEGDDPENEDVDFNDEGDSQQGIESLE